MALLLTIGLAVIGARVVGPTSERMYGDNSLWEFGPGGRRPPACRRTSTCCAP